MKLLRVISQNFKGCSDKIEISFLPKAQKSEVDKEFELLNIADGLYSFATIGIIGKNASGKTTVTELLAIVYELLSTYKLDSRAKDILKYNDDLFSIDITFLDEGYIYRYITDIDKNADPVNSDASVLIFKNECIYRKKYFKSNANKLFDYSSYEKAHFEPYNKPDEISLLFLIFGGQKRSLKGLYYTSNDFENYNYNTAFDIYKHFFKDLSIIIPLIKMFDENIEDLNRVTEKKYEIIFKNSTKREVSEIELHEILSSGTSKGFTLMAFVIWSLKLGVDLIIDEVETHFHKTLVENLINLYKDKSVNKSNATLIITTHYCELLDMSGRSDNLYVCHNDGKITVDNVYIKYPSRAALLKSKKFYNNEFETNVKYDLLMNFKKELVK